MTRRDDDGLSAAARAHGSKADRRAPAKRPARDAMRRPESVDELEARRRAREAAPPVDLDPPPPPPLRDSGPIRTKARRPRGGAA